jgi:hypothetical protein
MRKITGTVYKQTQSFMLKKARSAVILLIYSENEERFAPDG